MEIGFPGGLMTLARSDSERILKEAQGGDAEAFARLVAPLRDRLEALVYLLLGKKLRQRLEVEDVIQETLLRAHRSLGGFTLQDDDSLFRWLAALARHAAQDLARSHAAARRGGLDGEVPLGEREPVSPAVSPSRGLRREERLTRLEESLERLTPDHREVIILSHLEGLPTREVALRMGRSRPATAMLLLRALRELKAAFGSTDSLHLPEALLEAPPDRPGKGEAAR
jgi:RNA polymerase sigma-70 factor, ECF subfamily